MAEGGNGVVEFAHGDPDSAHVVVCRGKRGIQTNSLLQIIGGKVVPIDLMRDQAEQMDGIEVPRVGLQDLPVEQLGLVELAGLVKSQTLLEQIGQGRHGPLPGCERSGTMGILSAGRMAGQGGY